MGERPYSQDARVPVDPLNMILVSCGDDVDRSPRTSNILMMLPPIRVVFEMARSLESSAGKCGMERIVSW